MIKLALFVSATVESLQVFLTHTICRQMKNEQLLEAISNHWSRADTTTIRKEEDLPIYDKTSTKSGVDWRTMVLITLMQWERITNLSICG